MKWLWMALLIISMGCAAERSHARSTVPTTNNPHIIIDSNKGSTGAGF